MNANEEELRQITYDIIMTHNEDEKMELEKKRKILLQKVKMT